MSTCQMHVIYRWKSVYVFRPELARELSKVVETNLVKCNFDPVGQAFVLDGEKDEVVKAVETLHRSVDKAYHECVNNQRNPKYAPMIQRSKLSEFTAPAIVWSENVDYDDEGSIKRVRNAEFNLVRSWAPRSSDYSKLLHPPDSEVGIPTLIERVCDCRIEEDTFNRKLSIFANDPRLIETVVQKLDRLEQSFNATLPPKTTYLVYVEDKQDFDLRLVSLKSQMTTTGKTTLLGEKNKKYRRDRKLIYSLRLLRRADPVDKPSVVRLEIREIPGNRNCDGPRAWKDYIFRGYGSSENNPAVYIKPVAKPMVYNPVPQLNLQNHANQLSMALGAVVSETNDSELGLSPGFTAQNDDTIDLLMGSRPNFAPVEDEPVALPAAAKRRLRGFDETIVAPPNISQPEPPKFIPTVGTSSSYYDDDFGALLPPRPAHNSTPSPPPSAWKSQPGIVRTTRRVRTQDLVPEERQQEISEQETRKLRNINLQKKPKRVVREYSSKEHEKFNINAMHDIFVPGVDHVRLYKQKIIFEARIGRVIFDDAPPPSKCMAWEDLFPVIDDRRDTMKVIFTDRVTTDPVDVDYICDLKLSPTQNFFNYDPDERSVWYEFLCYYRGKPCLIKFDAETKDIEIFGQLETYGTVMWNCPLRSWDGRIVLQARKILNDEEPAFQSLTESFFTLDETRLPGISFRTESSELMVQKVYCKRESRFLVLPTSLTGPGRGFEFRMTEVQDLWMQSHNSNDEAFKALATDRLNMVANQRLHYAFSIVPTKSEKLFQEQMKLEVGEFPQWTVTDILGSDDGVIKAMTGIMNAVIERIDNVGFNNRESWDDNY